MTKWIIENKDWIVPISVALLSLFGSLLGGWLSSKKRIGIEVLSKNRQEWINDLRKKMASFILLSQTVPIIFIETLHTEQNETSKSSKDINDKLMNRYFSEVTKMREIQCYVKLLLNPNETKSSKLISLMDDIIKDITSIWKISTPTPPSERLPKCVDDEMSGLIIYQDLFQSKIPNLLNETQCILKEEWKRVKKGV